MMVVGVMAFVVFPQPIELFSETLSESLESLFAATGGQGRSFLLIHAETLNEELVTCSTYTLHGIPSKLVYRDQDSHSRGEEYSAPSMLKTATRFKSSD